MTDLTKFIGKANDLAILEGLPGEKVAGAFEALDGSIVVIMESGAAIVFVTLGGGTPAYWVESAATWEPRLAAIRREIESNTKALGRLIAAAPDAR